MSRKIILFWILSALLLTTCRSYSESKLATPIEGLNCRSYAAYFERGLGTSRGVECYYTCPNKIVGPLEFEVDPSLSFAKGDLDRTFCGIDPQFTPTEFPASPSPTPTAASSLTSTATPLSTSPASPTPWDFATLERTPVFESKAPFLTGQVMMCDLAVNLINFRIVQPLLDMPGKALTVQIAEQESTCYINPTNPSLLTCTIPPGAAFPARIVVSVDGIVTNDFTYDGNGCAKLSTPVPTLSP